jgi:hypothetical protein
MFSAGGGNCAPHIRNFLWVAVEGIMFSRRRKFHVWGVFHSGEFSNSSGREVFVLLWGIFRWLQVWNVANCPSV